MKGWTRTTLGEACEIVSGATPSTSVDDYWDGDVFWATPKDLSVLDGTRIAITARRITEAGLASCSATVLPPGSVLFSSRAPIGHVAINTVPMATNQGFKSFIPKPDRLHAPFLYWWLRTNRPCLESLGNGATFKEVSKAIVAGVEIPIPPLPEQRRIADTLDRADALRARRRAALAQVDGLTQAIFLEMFGDQVSNRWPVGRIGDLVRGFESGRSFEAAPDEASGGGFRVLKVSAVTEWVFRGEESKPVPREYAPPPSHVVRRSDLLFSRANTSELIGAVAYVNEVREGLLLSDKLWRFLWHEPPVADPEFIRALFRTPGVRREIARRATGTSGSMKNISQEKVLGIPTVIPPLPLQRSFASRAADVDKLKASHRTSLAQIDALFASLQHRAFRGEL